VRRKNSPEDLSIEELRRLLVEKRRASRQDRLERFRRTGRVVVVSPDTDGNSLSNLRSGELDETEDAASGSLPRSGSKRFLDGLLLMVEILAVAGLLFVLYNGMGLLQDLNQEVASALEQPTRTPTPLIVAAVLPSGHTPPNSPEGAQFNEAEIPSHLQPLVQSLANIPVPTAGPEQAISIQIPAIDVNDWPIVQGDGWEQLKKGVGQHVGSADPGQEGNLVLSGHNDIFGEVFRDLDQLKPGDEVVVYTGQRAYTYVVTGWKVVEPTQVEVMDPGSHASLTLISCYPYLVDKKRIVVTARLKSQNG
jgi:sortase A